VAVTADQVEAFHRDGFLFPIALNGAEEAEAVRAKWDKLEQREQLYEQRRNSMYNRHLDQQFIWDLVSSPVILDALEPLIGPNILLFGSRIICKWGNDETFIAWHQDVSERNQLSPPVQITAWYAIDAADEENACVYCIPGSHKQGMRARVPASTDGNLLRVNEESPVSPDEARSAVPVRLRAGEVSLHHGFTLHSSGANRSNRRRSGLVIRYVPAYVQQGDGVEFNQRETAITLRGVDELAGGAGSPFAPVGVTPS
jgi:hypothetical protein